MKHTDPTLRHDFLYVFDVTNGNPNGDPDAANMPRIDPESNQGLVTDVSLKRKVRDFVAMTQGANSNNKIFIQSQVALNTLIEKAGEGEKKDKKRANEKVRQRLCSEYYDIRMFGAVLSTGELNAGQVRGPMQVTFARSVDPIVPLDLSITRQARTTEERAETGTTEMGRKHIVPYGLYVARGHYNPYLATGESGTGVTQDDLALYWTALEKMFEFDRSASRGEMTARRAFVFTHETPLGNAPSHKLFDLVKVERSDMNKAPRQFSDYQVSVGGKVPDGVELTTLDWG